MKVIIATKQDGFEAEVMSRIFQDVVKYTETIFTTAGSCAKGTFQGPCFVMNAHKTMILARSTCVIQDAAVDEVIFSISDTLDAMGCKVEIIPLCFSHRCGFFVLIHSPREVRGAFLSYFPTNELPEKPVVPALGLPHNRVSCGWGDYGQEIER